MYWTSPCDTMQSGANVCNDFENHTDFERLTMANVVPHHEINAVFPNGTTNDDLFLNLRDNPYYNQTLDFNLIQVIEWNWMPGITGERCVEY